MRKIKNEKIATEYLYSKYPVAKLIKDNQAKLLKIKPLGQDKILILWAVKIDYELYGGVDRCGQECVFAQSEVLDWLPYNGEALGEYEQILFNPVLGMMIDVIEVTNEACAAKIIDECGSFNRAQKDISFFSRYDYDRFEALQKLNYYWARRIDLHSYAAVDIRSGIPDMVPSNERVTFFYRGDKVGNFVLVEEDGIKKLRKP